MTDETANKEPQKVPLGRYPAPRRTGQTLPVEYVARGSMMFAVKETTEKDQGRARPWRQMRVGMAGQVLTVEDGLPVWRDPQTQTIQFEQENPEW